MLLRSARATAGAHEHARLMMINSTANAENRAYRLSFSAICGLSFASRSIRSHSGRCPNADGCLHDISIAAVLLHRSIIADQLRKSRSFQPARGAFQRSADVRCGTHRRTPCFQRSNRIDADPRLSRKASLLALMNVALTCGSGSSRSLPAGNVRGLATPFLKTQIPARLILRLILRKNDSKSDLGPATRDATSRLFNGWYRGKSSTRCRLRAPSGRSSGQVLKSVFRSPHRADAKRGWNIVIIDHGYCRWLG